VGVNGLPREGDTYKREPWPLGGTPASNFYNVSITLDDDSIRIFNSWPKGYRSERVRWAIKNRHYGRDPELAETVERLRKVNEKLQYEAQLLWEENQALKNKPTGIRRLMALFFRK
tara:strand:+ start:503 stop:850 length:348 start_codon:yes stop_codon:yes gene_type:complete